MAVAIATVAILPVLIIEPSRFSDVGQFSLTIASRKRRAMIELNFCRIRLRRSPLGVFRRQRGLS
jgi:hypothetical protein